MMKWILAIGWIAFAAGGVALALEPRVAGSAAWLLWGGWLASRLAGDSARRLKPTHILLLGAPVWMAAIGRLIEGFGTPVLVRATWQGLLAGGAVALALHGIWRETVQVRPAGAPPVH
jgi:hypothetical protein